MHRVVLKHIPLNAPDRFPGLEQKVHRVLFGLFVLHWALVWARLWLPLPQLGNARWPDGLMLFWAAATTLASLRCRLPGQNVLLAFVIVLIVAGGIHSLGVLTAMPFGPFTYTDRIGQLLFYPLPWAVPLIWLVAILNARDVGRLVLRPWRQARAYGFWLLGVAALLVVLFDFGLEPYAACVKHCWVWKPTRIPSDWYTAPWVNFLGCGMTALLILVFLTPALLRKKPVKPPPPDFYPLLVWLLLNGLFVTGLAVGRLWAAVVVVAGHSVTVTVLAVSGAWKRERTG